MEIEKKVYDILLEINKNIATYTGNNLIGDGVIDSFGVIEIVTSLEAGLEIEIDASYIIQENFSNLNSIISLVNKILHENNIVIQKN